MHCENSEVLPFRSIAVAVTTGPNAVADVKVKLAFPTGVGGSCFLGLAVAAMVGMALRLNAYDYSYRTTIQREALTPKDLSSSSELEQRLLAFQSYYERTASPFRWAFTRDDLQALMARIDAKAPASLCLIHRARIRHRNSECGY
ncbi:MAG: hypothetical protein ACREDR_13190 [Blastocatellia bacterium]